MKLSYFSVFSPGFGYDVGFGNVMTVTKIKFVK